MPGMAAEEVVSRAVQSTLGLGTAVLVYGTALGGIFALAFAFSYGRLGALGARATSMLVAATGFRRDLPGAAGQIPGQPAVGRALGHHRPSHRPVRPDGAHLGGRHRRRRPAGPQT